MELKQIFEIQKSFDRQVDWNSFEKCETPEEIVAFMEHFTLVMVDELGEISRVRKKFLRDKQPLDVATLKKELVDIFVFVMQGSMALKMNLEDEYAQIMRRNEERFLKR
ncbi:MAG: dUTP diphosphatase [Candidatus Bathyarchaeota archaeon]|nr:dUTP diphosphatase [Candidatus Bathyarchaeota archaeon]